MERLDKFLCGAEIGTRKEVKELIRSGKVKVNNVIIKETAYKIDENKDDVTALGKPIKNKSLTYIIMNKPAGCICANSDPNRKTVFDILPPHLYTKGLFTVGRLDMDTTGLLLITNDGAFAHKLTSPKKHVPKTYYAEAIGKPVENATEIFKKGMPWGDETLKPAVLEIIETQNNVTKVYVTISEGKYHQVKRMLHNVGLKTTKLKRIKFGNLLLPTTLQEGDAQLLTPAELQTLAN